MHPQLACSQMRSNARHMRRTVLCPLKPTFSFHPCEDLFSSKPDVARPVSLYGSVLGVYLAEAIARPPSSCSNCPALERDEMDWGLNCSG